MGRYLSISLNFEARQSFSSLLAPIFSSDFFRPVSVGGFDGANWLLVGYDLSRFVSRFLRSKPRSKSVEICSKPEDSEYSYLKSLRDNIIHAQTNFSEFSPFETHDLEASITRVFSSYESTKLDAINSWISRFPKAIIDVYGSLELALNKESGIYLSRAYRPLYGGKPAQLPFLQIWVRKEPPVGGSRVTLTLYSSSVIWLTSAHTWNSRITEGGVNWNLNRMVDLCRQIVDTNRLNFQSTTISLEGNIFLQEESRIHTAFNDLQPFDK
jgi:hypothetical protein